MTSKHSIEILHNNARYIGRQCPVTRTEMKPGDQAIVCYNHNEAISWAALPMIGVHCPYCGQKFTLEEIFETQQRYYENLGQPDTHKESKLRPKPYIPSQRKASFPSSLLIIVATLSLILILGIVLTVGSRYFFHQSTTVPTLALLTTHAMDTSNVTRPSALVTKTPGPTNSPQPTSTSKFVCEYQSIGLFADLWPSHSELLGCSLQNEPLITTSSEQRFENGYMLWRKDKDRIYVVYKFGEQAGTFQTFDNQWATGNSAYSCRASPPTGKFQPQMGFGQIWCQLNAANASIGWALTKEEMYFDPGKTPTDFIVQDFEKGVILRDSEGGQQGFAYLLFDTGTFKQLSLDIETPNF